MELELVECEQKDCELIYNLANDSETRKNSFNSEYINYEEHCIWYEKSLNNQNRFMFIVKEEGIVIGQIRLDKISNQAVISYSIEKKSRGKGYANRLLDGIKSKAKEKDIQILEGIVKKDNIASRKAFLRNNFVEYEQESGFKYVLNLKEGMNIEEDADRR